MSCARYVDDGMLLPSPTYPYYHCGDVWPAVLCAFEVAVGCSTGDHGVHSPHDLCQAEVQVPDLTSRC
jgi:hypothetical protein